MRERNITCVNNWGRETESGGVDSEGWVENDRVW